MSGVSRDLRVCFVGDSYTAGVGDPDGRGWVGRATAAAHAAGSPITAYGLGVRGDTSLQIERRLLSELQPRLEGPGEPRLVLAFGVNDTVLDAGSPRVPAEATLESLQRIRAATPGLPVLMVGPTSVGISDQDRLLEHLDEQLRATCAGLDVTFVGCFAGTRASALWREELRCGDGYHPGAAGYDLLASIITPRLLEWLDDSI